MSFNTKDVNDKVERSHTLAEDYSAICGETLFSDVTLISSGLTHFLHFHLFRTVVLNWGAVEPKSAAK